MSLWTVLGLVVAVLLLLALTVLASTLRLELRLDPDTLRGAASWTLLSIAADGRARTLEVRLLRWRVVRRAWTDFSGGSRDEERSAQRREPKRRRSRGRSRTWRDVVDAWPFYRRQLRIAVSRLHVDRAHGVLRLATPDPALTGILYGAVCAVAAPFARRPDRGDFRVEPDFVGTFPGGTLDIAVRVRLAALAGLAWRITRHERARRGAPEKGRQHATS
jgi:hypothetical protein